ncbi:MAG: choice-of-anchor V domain-containing protein [Bacteroidota bacterium]
MKKKYLLILMLFITVSIVICSYIISPPTGSTSAPGEGSCGAGIPTCHHTGTINTGPGSAEIVMKGDETAKSYIPGQVYTIVPYTINTGDSVIGFETVALLANDSGAGTITLINPIKTEIYIPTPNQKNLKYVGHTQEGTANPGKYDWEYSWTAPPPGSGTVFIYGAFVAGQGDGDWNNDDVYTDTLILYEDTSPGIFSQSQHSQNLVIERIFPVPASEVVNIDIRTTRNSRLSITIIDIRGKVIITEPAFTVNSIKHCYKLNVSSLTEGIYFIKVKQGDKAEIIKRIVVTVKV